MSRAVHALRGEEPKLLRDWVAQRFLGLDDDELLAQFDAEPLSRHPAFHMVFALRNRLAEDELAAAVARGVTQYVILGAGLDSFAYRSPELMDRLDVFEVDHPETQAWKRRRVSELSLPMPERLHFVPVDFEREVLYDRLQAAGLNPAKPVFASMLGVSQYLSGAALARLLQDVAAVSRAGCTLVMEHVPPLAQLSSGERATLKRSVAGYTEAGEPWLTFLTSDALAVLQLDCGFTRAAPVGHGELKRRYFQAGMPEVGIPMSASYVKATVDP